MINESLTRCLLRAPHWDRAEAGPVPGPESNLDAQRPLFSRPVSLRSPSLTQLHFPTSSRSPPPLSGWDNVRFSGVSRRGTTAPPMSTVPVGQVSMTTLPVPHLRPPSYFFGAPTFTGTPWPWAQDLGRMGFQLRRRKLVLLQRLGIPPSQGIHRVSTTYSVLFRGVSSGKRKPRHPRPAPFLPGRAAGS